MSTIDQHRGRDFGDLVRELIEEAWRRARRRRAMYGGIVLALAVVGGSLFATLRSPSSESGSPAVAASPSSPVSGVAVSQNGSVADFRLKGERGNLALSIAFPATYPRNWNIHGGGQFSGRDLRSGQYDPLGGGKGKHVEVGGHASGWYARLVGFVAPKHLPKQHVVIKLKGRPAGTFVLIPMEPGVLKRDSGTQRSRWFG